MKLFLGIMLLLTITSCQGVSIFASMAGFIKALFGGIEMAPYQVVQEHEGFEERLYSARKWVGTGVNSPDYSPIIRTMFMKLFDYISGGNQENTKVEMTAPVATYVKPGVSMTCGTNFTMSFYIPEIHQENPPKPNASDVFIIDRPEMTVLTRRFGGYISDEVMIKEANELAELIQASGLDGVNFEQYFVVGYDPPFKPINRRNEIWYLRNSVSEITDNRIDN